MKAVLNLSYDAPIEIHASSDLQGVVTTLPKPYNKTVNEKRKLAADIIISENKS